MPKNSTIFPPNYFFILKFDDIIYISAEPNEYTISMLECAFTSVCYENLLEEEES